MVISTSLECLFKSTMKIRVFNSDDFLDGHELCKPEPVDLKEPMKRKISRPKFLQAATIELEAVSQKQCANQNTFSDRAKEQMKRGERQALTLFKTCTEAAEAS